MALFSEQRTRTLPLFRELDMDFTTGAPIPDGGGDFRRVSGREAVRIWIARALQPENARFLYSAHTDSYGNAFLKLVGGSFAEAEARLPQMIRETLLVCPYISRVGSFSFQRKQNGLSVAFEVETVYGSMTAESEMMI